MWGDDSNISIITSVSPHWAPPFGPPAARTTCERQFFQLIWDGITTILSWENLLTLSYYPQINASNHHSLAEAHTRSLKVQWEFAMQREAETDSVVVAAVPTVPARTATSLRKKQIVCGFPEVKAQRGTATASRLEGNQRSS